MQSKRLSFFAAAMLVMGGLALSESTTVGDIGAAKRGPCQRAVQAIPIVPACEPTCTLWCTDPCKAVIVTPGKCLNEEGPCSEFTDTFTGSMCRDCGCPFGGGACSNDGVYSSGTQKKINCVDAA